MEHYLSRWLDENDEKLKANRQTYDHLSTVKCRAKKRGLDFNLDADDMEFPETCPILGISISAKLGRDNWPSFDRVDNSKGYTKDNVRVISARANMLKNANTIKTLESILKYMKGTI